MDTPTEPQPTDTPTQASEPHTTNAQTDAYINDIYDTWETTSQTDLPELPKEIKDDLCAWLK